MDTITLASAAPRLALPWIVRLRYAMAAGQMLTVLVVDQVLNIDLPLVMLAIAPAITIVTNLWLARTNVGSGEQRTIFGVFGVDALCLTGILMLTGGPSNPFSLLYLVHLTLSATILTRKQTWGLGVLSTACFGALFFWNRPIAQLEMHHHTEGVNLHLAGMWLGFGVASFLVAMFAGKISELLREREESLLRMQQELARKERLASLATLSAGAAHELNTPLGTIAIAAKELERYATTTVRDPAIAADSRLIREEVERCREILTRMSVQGAEPAGEASSEVRVGDLVQEVAFRFPGIQFGIHSSTEAFAKFPKHAVEQSIEAMVRNALDASAGAAHVSLSLSSTPETVHIVVADRGTGMSSDTLQHVGEPFFTTKEPGRGMGLGLFLVRTLAESLGGAFHLESALGQGTKATLSLPATTMPSTSPKVNG